MADAGSTLASAPIGQLIRDMAMAIADAQEHLDAAAIRTAQKMAETVGFRRDGEDGEETFTLLELGFAPTFYSFIEADLELVVETRISEATSTGVSVGAELSGTTTGETPASDSGTADTTPDTPTPAGGSGSPQGARSSTRAVGMTMSAEFQRKFAVETSGHTRITAKLVALPPPAQFLEIVKTGAA